MENDVKSLVKEIKVVKSKNIGYSSNQYSQYVSECLDRTIKYTEYLSEQTYLDTQYSDYLSEKLNALLCK